MQWELAILGTTFNQVITHITNPTPPCSSVKLLVMFNSVTMLVRVLNNVCHTLAIVTTTLKPFGIYIIQLSTHSAKQCPLRVPFT